MGVYSDNLALIEEEGKTCANARVDGRESCVFMSCGKVQLIIELERHGVVPQDHSQIIGNSKVTEVGLDSVSESYQRRVRKLLDSQQTPLSLAAAWRFLPQ